MAYLGVFLGYFLKLNLCRSGFESSNKNKLYSQYLCKLALTGWMPNERNAMIFFSGFFAGKAITNV